MGSPHDPKVMRISKPQLGDIFEVRIDFDTKSYFQYIADDLTQMNAPVIRAFIGKYPMSASPSFQRLVVSDVDFHAHTYLKLGVKNGIWSLVGNISPQKTSTILFRDSHDYGNPQFEITLDVSRNWFVWQPNGSRQEVGELSGELRKAEIGVVMPPDTIAFRIRNGVFDFVYPRFE